MKMKMVRFDIVLVFVLYVSVVLGKDDVDGDDNNEDGDVTDSPRGLRELNPERWRAVQKLPPEDSSNNWTPTIIDDNKPYKDPLTGKLSTDHTKAKRRRIRKRKRRPQQQQIQQQQFDDYNNNNNNNNNKNEEEIYVRRRKRPYRLGVGLGLEQSRHPWEELVLTLAEEEEELKPNKRRRLPLVNQQQILPVQKQDIITQEKQKIDNNAYKNDVIKDVDNNEDTVLKEKRRNNEINNVNNVNNVKNNEETIKTINNNDDEQKVSHKSLSIIKKLLKENEGKVSLSELLQQKNLTLSELLNGKEDVLSTLIHHNPIKTQNNLVNNNNNNKNINDTNNKADIIINIDEVTETNEDIKDVVNKVNKLSEETRLVNDKTEDKVGVFTTLIKFDVINEATTDNNTNKRVDYINVNVNKNVYNTTISNSNNKLPTTNAMLKTITNNNKINNTINNNNNNKSKTNTDTVINTDEEATKTKGPVKVSINLEQMFDKFDKKPDLSSTSNNNNETYVTAKEEIMEILKDPASRDKLSQILTQRNMSLDELVEQRQRGSSQLHLADIFHNNTKEPEPKEVFIGRIAPDYVKSRQQKSNKIEVTPTATSTTTIINTFPWKELYPELFTESTTNDFNNIINDIDRIDVDSRLLSSLTPDADDSFFGSVPSGIKSALFVSTAIIGLSIVVFLAVLLVLKYVQSRSKVNYCGSLATRFRTSSGALRNSSTMVIKSFVNETLGRKKNYYKNSLQSMSDEWEREANRKVSF